MRSRRGVLCLLLLLLGAVPLVAGCAGTRSDEIPNDPRLIRNEIAEIEGDILNAEEMLKGSRAQIQVDDSQEIRSQIASLESEIAQLKSQKAALEERLRELETAQ